MFADFSKERNVSLSRAMQCKKGGFWLNTPEEYGSTVYLSFGVCIPVMTSYFTKLNPQEQSCENFKSCTYGIVLTPDAVYGFEVVNSVRTWAG